MRSLKKSIALRGPSGPYLAVGGFGETDGPGPAEGVEVSGDGRTLTLTGIPLGNEPVTVDWVITFDDETVDLTYDWHVTGPTTAPVWEVAWNWDTVLPNYGDPENPDRGGGGAADFADWSIAHDDDLTLVAAIRTGRRGARTTASSAPATRWCGSPCGTSAAAPSPRASTRVAPGAWAPAGRAADTEFAEALHAELNAGPPP